MKTLRILSPAEQVAAHLSQQIIEGLWSEEVPGAPALCKALGVDHRVVITAFGILEKQGLLVQQGIGKRRKVVTPQAFVPPVLRFKILTYEESDRHEFYFIELMHRLNGMGHVASIAQKTLRGMNMNLSRVKRLVQDTEADAWIIFAASKEILEWFIQQSAPSFAFAGRWPGLPIAAASPDKLPAFIEVTRRLRDLGHRRIVMLTSEQHRKPNPARFVQAFMDELQRLGLPVGEYNVPDWKPEATDYHRCLDSLFRHTPPTALLIDTMPLFISAQLYLAQRGILAPHHVSLISLDPNPAYEWCNPTIAHIHWDPEPVIRRITSWANNIACGKDDKIQSFTKATFVEGDTLGPVPK